MTTVWQRARSDEQKQKRRSALLDAGARLLATKRIDEVSLNAIAKEANISKANVYRYFESREDLFLQLTLSASRAWRATLLRQLETLQGSGDATGVGMAIAVATEEHETFARLITVLTTVFEHNVSTDSIFRFKVQLLSEFEEVLESTQRALPDLFREQVQHVLQTAYLHIAAVWPVSHPPPAVRAALERPELAPACVEFAPSIVRLVEVTVAGHRAEAAASRQQ